MMTSRLLLILCTLGGAAAAAPGSPPVPVPKITSVTPSMIVLEGRASETLVLRGENLSGTNPVITIESKPGHGKRPCTSITLVNAREIACVVSAPDRTLPVGTPITFSVALVQNNKVVLTEPSLSSVTVVRPLLASSVCMVDARKNVQLLLHGRGLSEASTVEIDFGARVATCANLQTIGPSDLVCFLAATEYAAWTGARLRVLRSGESGGPGTSNAHNSVAAQLACP